MQKKVLVRGSMGVSSAVIVQESYPELEIASLADTSWRKMIQMDHGLCPLLLLYWNQLVKAMAFKDDRHYECDLNLSSYPHRVSNLFQES